MKKLIAAALAVAACSVFAVPAAHSEDLPCTLSVPLDGSYIVTPGADDCTVSYVTEDEALNAVYSARASGEYIFHENGFIVSDGAYFTVRVSKVAPAEYIAIHGVA